MVSSRFVREVEGKQLLRHEQCEVEVSASGDSLQAASNGVFQLMRKQMFKEYKQPIVRMEAREIYFDEVDCEERTERFLFLFWPRTKKTYRVRARIVVNVDYLDIIEEDQ